MNNELHKFISLTIELFDSAPTEAAWPIQWAGVIKYYEALSEDIDANNSDDEGIFIRALSSVFSHLSRYDLESYGSACASIDNLRRLIRVSSAEDLEQPSKSRFNSWEDITVEQSDSVTIEIRRVWGVLVENPRSEHGRDSLSSLMDDINGLSSEVQDSSSACLSINSWVNELHYQAFKRVIDLIGLACGNPELIDFNSTFEEVARLERGIIEGWGSK